MPKELCIVCGKSGDVHKLGVWFVDDTRSLIHVDCWDAEYRVRNPETPPEEQTA